MLSELLQKLEAQHGIPQSQGSSILNTIAQHIKEKFPQVGGMLDSVLGTGTAASSDTAGTQSTTGNEVLLSNWKILPKVNWVAFLGNKFID
jgi:hypothetical protein